MHDPSAAGVSPLPLNQPDNAKLGLIDILSTVEETAYIWDLKTDLIDWESNATTVLGVGAIGDISTGADFNTLITAEDLAGRNQAIGGQHSAVEKAIPYRVQYRFAANGQYSAPSICLEDHGSWWADKMGKGVRARGIIRVITDRYAEEQRLLFRSNHDELTGQLNRIRLTEALEATIQATKRRKGSAAFLMVAVNNMASVNDAFGFDTGDEVIAAVGRLLRVKMRTCDLVGRFSSNKFGVVLTDCGAVQMRFIAEQLMKAVNDKTIQTSTCKLPVSVSIGGVLIPSDAYCVQRVVSHSLQALDSARLKQNDCFRAYEPNPMQESLRHRNKSIANDVISALDDNRMLLALQPIVSTKTRKLAFYECLLRLAQPDGTIISAGDFIEVAEQLGLSRLIDRRTLDLSLAYAKLNPHVHLSLNVSSMTCIDPEWMAAMQRMTGGDRSITERLTIEITETTAIVDMDQSVAFVDTLKELGCRVALDDFGAGYTSFKNLKHLAVDIIKIDGAFVRNLAADKADVIFINTIVDLARSFGMKTVAEWVADEKTAALLADAGVDYLQGFHFGKPEVVVPYVPSRNATHG